MKRMLFVLVVLLGFVAVAPAQEVQNPIVERYLFHDDGTLEYWQGGHLVMSDFRVTTSNDKDTDVDADRALLSNEEGNYYNALCPDINLDNSELEDPFWSLSYTVENVSTDKVQITNLMLHMYGMHGSLGEDPQPISGDVVIEVIPGYVYQGQEKVFTSDTITLQGSGDYGLSSGVEVMDLPTGFALNPGESITIFLTVRAPHEASANYTNLFVGIKDFELSGSYTKTVPEPTTATLSLLALAGLAARRRRK